MECDWTTQNLQKLFASLKANIPAEEEDFIYTKGLKQVEWEKVAFPPFSAEQCREMWTCFMQKMRKIRSLKEIVEEAEGLVSTPNPNDTIQSQCPKVPLPPNALYLEANLEKIRRKHPGRDIQSLLELSSKKFNNLPEEEKAKFEEKHVLECVEYKKKMQLFCQKYVCPAPQKKSQSRKRALPASDKKHPDMPPKPPTNGYVLFCKEQSSSVKNVAKSRYIKEWARLWRDLSQKQKMKYAERCRELNEEYNIKMSAYLERLDEEERQQFIKENKISANRRKKPGGSGALKRWLAEPKMPSLCGNSIFCQEQMALLKEEIPNLNERFCKAMKMWNSLSNEKKADYQRKKKKKIQKYSEELQNWFSALTPRQKREYWMSNRYKRKYLDTNEASLNKVPLCEPSDSEDEDIVISSSEEEENTLTFGQEEDYGEEEENFEIHMFEI
uniref:HMG box domain-containing protein n=1 Tax=Oryzias sinensis TaxID=183150 RepID=A0A8C7XE59_9TELE